MKTNLSHLAPGSYIFTDKNAVLDVSSFRLHVSRDKLFTHLDFYCIEGKGSIGIDEIRQINTFLRSKPAISLYKIVMVTNFHLATNEAQNAFLKRLEEPPEYAFIFLVTPYVDRLLKTIVSRAQVIGNSKLTYERSECAAKAESQNAKLQLKTVNCKLKTVLNMNVGERFLWLENEVKNITDKSEMKTKFLEIVNSFFDETTELLQKKQLSIQAVEYLKEARWKIEQGFPNPKLLIEGFFVML